jgi:hypothetical protein
MTDDEKDAMIADLKSGIVELLGILERLEAENVRLKSLLTPNKKGQR